MIKKMLLSLTILILIMSCDIVGTFYIRLTSMDSTIVDGTITKDSYQYVTLAASCHYGIVFSDEPDFWYQWTTTDGEGNIFDESDSTNVYTLWPKRGSADIYTIKVKATDLNNGKSESAEIKVNITE